MYYSNLVSAIIILIAATIFPYLGSRWIDALYARNYDILSFPWAVATRARYRLTALAVSMTCATSTVLALPADTNLPLPFIIAALFFLILITATDFEQHVIFDKMLSPFACLGLLTITQRDAIAIYLLAAAVGGLLFFALAVFTRGGIGGGDIKLIAVLGLWLGGELVSVIIYGMIAGGIAATIMVLVGQKKARETFAYGPYFTIAAMWYLIK